MKDHAGDFFGFFGAEKGATFLGPDPKKSQNGSRPASCHFCSSFPSWSLGTKRWERDENASKIARIFSSKIVSSYFAAIALRRKNCHFQFGDFDLPWYTQAVRQFLRTPFASPSPPVRETSLRFASAHDPRLSNVQDAGNRPRGMIAFPIAATWLKEHEPEGVATFREAGTEHRHASPERPQSRITGPASPESATAKPSAGNPSRPHVTVFPIAFPWGLIPSPIARTIHCRSVNLNLANSRVRSRSGHRARRRSNRGDQPPGSSQNCDRRFRLPNVQQHDVEVAYSNAYFGASFPAKSPATARSCLAAPAARVPPQPRLIDRRRPDDTPDPAYGEIAKTIRGTDLRSTSARLELSYAELMNRHFIPPTRKPVKTIEGKPAEIVLIEVPDRDARRRLFDGDFVDRRPGY